ncbi:MAG: PQQ-dependent sugar dehydrogenase [Bacteroidetes bacterium]|nr:PQQ-dependent sugar dehydrogenase [Bacteroidota bacterium]
MRNNFTLAATFFASLFFFQNGHSQPDLNLLPLTSVSSPVDIANANDGSGRLFLVQKDGQIRIFDLNTFTLLPGNFLDISALSQNNDERGLLGLAFHPNYVSNGYFYVNYVNNAGNTVISRFTASPPSTNGPVSLATEFVIMTVAQPFSNHNGGDLEFGPDGYLYIPLGDGGSGGDPGNRSQNPQELLGKMLRIDINGTSGGNNYAIPPSNPLVGVQTPVDYRDEIWALGLRNPWRFSFDRSTGDIWIADVGQGAWEEVDFQPASSTGGENYGWRCYEGDHTYNTSGCGPQGSYVAPIFEYGHNPTTGGNSISGGYVYRGSISALQGWYVMADYTSDNFWLIKSDGSGGWTVDLQDNIPVVDIVTFGEAQNGDLYAGSLGGGIYKVSISILPIELVSFRGEYADSRVVLKWTTASEVNASHFLVERKTESKEFLEIGKVTATGGRAGSKYSFTDALPFSGVNFYRLKMVDQDGSFKYSSVISVLGEVETSWKLVPNPATSAFSLVMDAPAIRSNLQVQVFDIHGKEVISKEIESPRFPIKVEFSTEDLMQGVYFCQLRWDGNSEAQRLVVR